MWKRAESPGSSFAAHSGGRYPVRAARDSRPNPPGPSAPLAACAPPQRPVSRASRAPLAPCSAPSSPCPPCPRAPPAQRPAPTEQQQPVSPPQVAPLLAEPAVDAPADPPGLSLLRALLVGAAPPVLRRSPDRGQVQVRHRVQVRPRALHGRLRVSEEQRPEAVAQSHLGAGRGPRGSGPGPCRGAGGDCARTRRGAAAGRLGRTGESGPRPLTAPQGHSAFPAGSGTGYLFGRRSPDKEDLWSDRLPRARPRLP